MGRRFVSIGAWLAMVGVALGAFGTHGLRGKISDANLEIWRTSVQYHVVHAIAIIVVGILMKEAEGKMARRAGWLFVGGIVVFGGSLYALALTDIKVLGAITPLGGLCFLAGWASLAMSPASELASKV